MHFYPFPSSEISKLFSTTKMYRYIESYVLGFCDGNSVSAIVEYNYTDKDYLIDYSYYYSRCFEDIHKKVIRIHFFCCDTKQLESSFSAVLDNPIYDQSKVQQDLNDCYVGFATIKPITRNSLGRSIFKPYPEHDQNDRRRSFSVYCDTIVNVAGISLKLNALPFQEQDMNVAACATTSVWVALNALRRVFDHGSYYSQYELTNTAFDTFDDSVGRKFPNEGLTDHQILYLLKKIGYDPVYYFVENENNLSIDNIITSHTDMGIPLLCFLKLTSQESVDYHLVTISGFKTEADHREIVELYVHDDQIGFYSKVEFEDNNRKKWINEWITEYNMDKVELVAIVAPLYHKIRISYTSIEAYINSVFPDLKFDAYLKTISCLREILRNNHTKNTTYTMIKKDGNNTNYSFREVMLEMMPKYLWIAKLKEHGNTVYVVFDATSYNVDPLMVVVS
jgi:hypothetical protein